MLPDPDSDEDGAYGSARAEVHMDRKLEDKQVPRSGETGVAAARIPEAVLRVAPVVVRHDSHMPPVVLKVVHMAAVAHSAEEVAEEVIEEQVQDEADAHENETGDRLELVAVDKRDIGAEDTVDEADMGLEDALYKVLGLAEEDIQESARSLQELRQLMAEAHTS